MYIIRKKMQVRVALIGEDYMELRQLYHFKIVAETGVISIASELLFISQSALSQSIQKLEKELGFKLFDRTKNKIMLNSAGEIVLQHVNRILDEVENLREFADEYMNCPKKVRMATSIPACLRFFIPYFNAIDTEIQVSGLLMGNNQLEKGLQNDLFDFVIVAGHTFSDENIIQFPLFNDNLKIGVPAAHPFALRESIAFNELNNCKILTMAEHGSYFSKCINYLQKKNNVKLNLVKEEDYMVYYEQCKNTEFMTFASDLSLNYNKQENRKYISIIDEDATFECFFAYKSDCPSHMIPFIEKIRQIKNVI